MSQYYDSCNCDPDNKANTVVAETKAGRQHPQSINLAYRECRRRSLTLLSNPVCD